MKTGFLISGYIPTTLVASSAIAINSSKVIIGNFPDKYQKFPLQLAAATVGFKVCNKEEKAYEHITIVLLIPERIPLLSSNCFQLLESKINCSWKLFNLIVKKGVVKSLYLVVLLPVKKPVMFIPWTS